MTTSLIPFHSCLISFRRDFRCRVVTRISSIWGWHIPHLGSNSQTQTCIRWIMFGTASQRLLTINICRRWNGGRLPLTSSPSAMSTPQSSLTVVLDDEDLRERILSFGEDHDLVQCALVSRAWSNTALDVLWSSLESIVPLFSILSPLIVPNNPNAGPQFLNNAVSIIVMSLLLIKLLSNSLFTVDTSFSTFSKPTSASCPPRRPTF